MSGEISVCLYKIEDLVKNFRSSISKLEHANGTFF